MQRPGLTPSFHLNGGGEVAGGGHDSIAAGGVRASDVGGMEAEQRLRCWHISRQDLSKVSGR